MPTRKKTTKPKARAAKKPAAPKARAHAARKQPESLRLRSAEPGFTVNDLARSIAFYTGSLGFVVAERWEMGGALAGVTLKAGQVSLMLGQDDFAKGRDRAKGAGSRIWCRTTQDIDQLAARIKANGATLDEEPADMPWGDRVFSLTDPDGFKLTFAQR